MVNDKEDKDIARIDTSSRIVSEALASTTDQLLLLIDAAQNAIDDYDAHRNGSERSSMELLRATLKAL